MRVLSKCKAGWASYKMYSRSDDMKRRIKGFEIANGSVNGRLRKGKFELLSWGVVGGCMKWNSSVKFEERNAGDLDKSRIWKVREV